MNTTKLLRFIGVGVLLASGLSFLLEGWETLNSFHKYLGFLGLGALMTVLGVLLDKKFHEEKGALALLGAVTAFLPVHFAQLGAFILHRSEYDFLPVPELFQINLPSNMGLGPIVVATLLAVLPMAYFGVKKLFPQGTLPAAGFYLLSNSLLLIPTRNADFIVALGLGSFALYLGLEIMILRKQKQINKLSYLNKAMLLTPTVVLLGRELLYPLTPLYFAGLYLLAFTVLFALLPFVFKQKDHTLAELSRLVSLVPLFMGLQSLLNDYFQFHYNHEVFALLLLPLSLLMPKTGTFVRMFNFFYGGFIFVLHQNELLDMGFALIMLIGSHFKRDKINVTLFSVLFLFHLGHGLYRTINWPEISLWIGLGSLGVALILIAAVVDKKKKSIMNLVNYIKNHYKSE